MADINFVVRAVNSAFRDYNVEGVSASGPHEPLKSAIRAALAQMAGLARSAGTTLVFDAVADMTSYNQASLQDAARAEVRNDPDGNIVGANGIWSLDKAAGIWIWMDHLVPQSIVDSIEAAVLALYASKLDAAPTWFIDTDVEIGGAIAAVALIEEGGRVLWAAMHDGTTYDPDLKDFSVTDPRYIAGICTPNNQTLLSVDTAGSVTIRGQPQVCGFPALSMVLIKGQSNAGAAESLPLVSDFHSDIGDVMFVTGTQQWHGERNPTTPEQKGDSQFELVPLREQNDGEARGEFGNHGLGAQFKLADVGGRYAAGSLSHAAPHLLFACPDTGGRYLKELGPDDPTDTGHWVTTVDVIQRAREQAAALSLPFGIIAIDFCQGETDGSSFKLEPDGDVLSRADLIAGWKAELIALKAEIEEQASQKRPIPVFITQVLVEATATAQEQIASEHPDFYLVGPIYPYPSAINSWYRLQHWGDLTYRHGSREHFAADGRRWNGEQKGKVMRHVLREGVNWKPLSPLDVFRVDDRTLHIKLHVPVAPVILNTDALVRVEDYGFAVYGGTVTSPGARKAIDEVQVIGPDMVEIKLGVGQSVAAQSEAFVSYGYNEVIDAVDGPFDVREGDDYPNGRESTEIVFAGDQLNRFGAIRFGAFLVATAVPAGAGVIRDVRYDPVADETVLRGETLDFTGTMEGGSPLVLKRDNKGGNLSDSDPTLAHFHFADPAYGDRQGELYPLNNFCIQFNRAVRT